MRPLSLLIDFFDMDIDKPTDSAFSQQRAKLKQEAPETVFQKFNESVDSLDASPEYRFLAADGSTATFFSKPRFSPNEYFVEPGHSAKGFYSVPFQRTGWGFDFPDKEAFDIDADVTLVRSHSSKIKN